MVGALDDLPVEPALEEMAGIAVPVVEPLGIGAVEPLHPGRDVRLASLDHEMEMIRHQAIRVAFPPQPPDDVFQNGEKPNVVTLCVKDFLPAITTGDHVIDAAGKLESGQSRHSDQPRKTPDSLGMPACFWHSSGEVSGHDPGSDPRSSPEGPCPLAGRSKTAFVARLGRPDGSFGVLQRLRRP